MKRRDLESRLAAIPRLPEPRAELEQYRTPDAVAAEFLLAAHAEGAIAGKLVVDLGCGTGVFAIGAALLGATLATGVDIDAPSIGAAQQAAAASGVQARTWFVCADVAAWRPDAGGVDTVVMNPPFGAQRANRHADRVFLRCAADAVRPRGGTVWFLAQESTEPFLGRLSEDLGGTLERVAVWDYPLEATMRHHAEAARIVRIGGYRMAVKQATSR